MVSRVTKANRIVEIATKALELMGTSGVEGPYTGNKILEFARSHYLMSDQDQSELSASWHVTLSWARQSDESRITKESGRNGYILASIAPAETQTPDARDEFLKAEASVAATPAVPFQQREAKLYELLTEWLAGQGYRTGIVSNKKTPGIWRNPDVAGILITPNVMGGAEVEIATIEAKLAVARVDSSFFEAVAHKRFANRVYFALVAKINEKIHSEFRVAAERFNVGILVVRLEEDDYEKLLKGDVSDLLLAETNYIIDESWPAMYESVPAREMDTFLRETLDIDRHDKLYKFGIDPKE